MILPHSKKYYLRRSFNNLIKEIDKQYNENNDVIRQFWMNYDIMPAVKNIYLRPLCEIRGKKYVLNVQLILNIETAENVSNLNNEMINLAHT